MTKRPRRSSRTHELRLGASALWDILSDSIRNFLRNNDGNQAAAIAFYGILSMIPFFLLTLWAVGLLFGSDSRLQSMLIDRIQSFSPYFSNDLLNQIGFIEQKKAILGWAGMIALLWSSSLIFESIEGAFNAIFRVQKGRNYLVTKTLAISMIPLGWSLGMASVAVSYFASLVQHFDWGWVSRAALWNTLWGYVVPYVVMTAFFTILYKVVPVGRISWGNALTGSILFSALMEVAKHFFTSYIVSSGRYGVIYGSLQTVVILVLWFFYTALILLFCAELISSYRRRSLILLEKVLTRPGTSSHLNERLFRKFGRMYKKGDYIFREGDTGRDIYYVLIGGVAIEKKTGTASRVLSQVGPGQYFGEMAALAGQARTASVRASEDSEIAVIDADTFKTSVSDSHEISLMLLQEFSRRIKRTNEQFEDVTSEWLRYAAVLYFIRNWPLQKDRDPARELAEKTGRDPSAVADVLRDMEDAGILHRKEGRLCGFNREKAFESLGTGADQAESGRRAAGMETA